MSKTAAENEGNKEEGIVENIKGRKHGREHGRIQLKWWLGARYNEGRMWYTHLAE